MVDARLAAPSKSVDTRLRRAARTGVSWLPLVVPGLLVYAVLNLGPIAGGAVLSLTNWNGIRPSLTFVGLDNYVTAIADAEFSQAVRTTLILTVALTVAINCAAVGMAALLNRQGLRFRMYRAIVFAPLVVAPVVVGFLWRAFLYRDGIVNQLLEEVGIDAIPFLGDPTFALGSVGFVILWHTVGFVTVIYLAALQAIPQELYEAARIDGAGGRALFRNVTLPLLAPAITVNVALVIIFSIREYDHVLSLTAGGPLGATETIVWRIIREGFFSGNLGLASAMSVLLMLMIAVAVAATFGLFRRKEHAAE